MHENDHVTVFKALADKTRLDIVKTLAAKPAATSSCSLVSSCSSLSQPAMSHHFGKLVDAGILLESKAGTEKMYKLNQPLLESVGIDIHKL